MATRILLVSPEIFIDFLKDRQGESRSYTIERALPDDARLVGLSQGADGQYMQVHLESGAWDGTEPLRLDSPRITLHLGN